jgi:hypothetical protein
MDKKAQGLSMNVIIIAAISLLVLIILIVLVLRASSGVNEQTGCLGVGGQCYSGTSCADLETQYGGTWSHSLANDGKRGKCLENEICCQPLEQVETQ